jgi:hypothetical protein
VSQREGAGSDPYGNRLASQETASNDFKSFARQEAEFSQPKAQSCTGRSAGT